MTTALNAQPRPCRVETIFRPYSAPTDDIRILTDNRWGPIRIKLGAGLAEFTLLPNEAMELGELISAAGRMAAGAKPPGDVGAA